MIDPETIAIGIQNQISISVETAIRDYVDDVMQSLAKDQQWIQKIEREINDNVARRLGQKLSMLDVNSVIAQEIDGALDRYFKRQRAPVGIKDTAGTLQMTVQDGSVTIERDLLSRNATIKDTLTVQNLAVRGSINTDNQSWEVLAQHVAQKSNQLLTEQWRADLVQQVQQKITESGINFSQVKVNDRPLVDGDRLSGVIKHSDLRSIGMLETLQVTGESDIAGLSVRARRVGINTRDPDMALAIWDEEVALVFGKHKEQTAYVGTLRPQRMIIGINRTPAIDISDQGRVTVNHLTVGRHRVCHEPECPNYSGTKGDIVFNNNPKGDGVWGWQCLGAFRWIPLRTT